MQIDDAVRISELKRDCMQAGDHIQVVICDIACGLRQPFAGVKAVRAEFPKVDSHDVETLLGIESIDDARQLCFQVLEDMAVPQ